MFIWGHCQFGYKKKIPKKKKTLVACKNEKTLGNPHFGRWTQDYVMGSLACGLIT